MDEKYCIRDCSRQLSKRVIMCGWTVIKYVYLA